MFNKNISCLFWGIYTIVAIIAATAGAAPSFLFYIIPLIYIVIIGHYNINNTLFPRGIDIFLTWGWTIVLTFSIIEYFNNIAITWTDCFLVLIYTNFYNTSKCKKDLS